MARARDVPVRAARRGDLDAIWRIEQAAFEPHRRVLRRSLALSLASPTQRVWVATRARAIVGFLVAWVRPKTWRIYDVAVSPAAQGGGIGTRLIQHAERAAVQGGARRIVLEADAAHRGYYERLGYDVVAPLPDFYGPGRDAVRLAKDPVA